MVLEATNARQDYNPRRGMPVTRATWPIAVVLLAACGPRAPNATDSQPSPPTPGAAVTQSAAPAAAPSSLSPQPPFDIPPQAKQAQVVTYAWQQFVALNWPAASGQRGVPDTTKTIGQPGTVVWHTWKTPDEIFYPAGQTPPPWNRSGGQLPPQCSLGRRDQHQLVYPSGLESARRPRQPSDPGGQGSRGRYAHRSARQSRAL